MSKSKKRKPIKFKPKELNIDVMFPDTAWSSCGRCGMAMVADDEYRYFTCLTCGNIKEYDSIF